MKKSYTFYLWGGVMTATVLLLSGMKYPAPLYSPGELTEKHSKLRCKDCHAPFKRVPSESCSVADCHAGAIGKKAALKDLHGKLREADCLACHTDHKGPKGRITVALVHDKLPAKTRCVDCHSTEGKKAHKDKYGDACKGCHTTENWKAVTFSHERVAASPCGDCHKGPKDQLHAGAGGECRGCHTTKAWKPATLDHDRYFPLDREHNVECGKCHETKSYKAYTCMNCHIHAGRGIIGEHAEEGIRDFGDCLRCHRVYMKGRTYGTDRTGEGESMIDDEHEYRRDNRYRREYDDDEHGRGRGVLKRWFDDDDD